MDVNWKTENGKWKMENGKWKMKNGKWKMENGKWKMKNGKWKMENGECKVNNANSKSEILQCKGYYNYYWMCWLKAAVVSSLCRLQMQGSSCWYCTIMIPVTIIWNRPVVIPILTPGINIP